MPPGAPGYGLVVRFAYDVIGIIRDQIRDGGRRSEVGGLLFGRDEEVVGVFAAPNVAPAPQAEFRIDPEVMDHLLLNEEARGHELLGSYHSHPRGSAEMSGADAAMAMQTGLLLIIACERGRPWDWRLWDPVASGEAEFVVAPPYQL